MGLLYIFIACFVICFLLFIPFYPFWRFAKELKENYSKVWFDQGPFGLTHMLAHSVLMSSFFKVMQHAADGKAPFDEDKVIKKWAHLGLGIYTMRPKNFFMQILYLLIFVYFVGFLTSLLMRILGA